MTFLKRRHAHVVHIPFYASRSLQMLHSGPLRSQGRCFAGHFNCRSVGGKKAELVFKLFTLHGSVRVCLCTVGCTLPSLFVSSLTREGRQCPLCPLDGLSVIRALCLPLGSSASGSLLLLLFILLSRICRLLSVRHMSWHTGVIKSSKTYVLMRNMVRIKPNSIQRSQGKGADV